MVIGPTEALIILAILAVPVLAAVALVLIVRAAARSGQKGGEPPG